MKGLFRLGDYIKGTVYHLELCGFYSQCVRILVFGFKHLLSFFPLAISCQSLDISPILGIIVTLQSEWKFAIILWRGDVNESRTGGVRHV